jgi:predicted TIM-barrel fold metal-dependent hydrolase
VTPTAIDSHAHVFVRGLPLVAGRRHEPDHDATLADYLALLDAHGISHGVLVQPSFLGTDNRFLRAALRARPDRLRGVAVVDPSIDDAALRGLDDDGVRGIRLNLIGRPAPDLESADWRRLFARVRALDWHVEVHAESQRLGAIAAPVLAAGCALVVDHFGRPSVAPPSQDPGFAWLLDAAADGRVWVKLSAAYRNGAPTQTDASAIDAAQALCAAFGAERLVWGSDWPHTQHRDVADFTSAHAALAVWVPDADERRRILVDTPAQLFDFQPGDLHAE